MKQSFTASEAFYESKECTESKENTKKALQSLFADPSKGRMLLLSFFLALLFFGINLEMEYASDTYSTFMEAETWKWMLYENGRIVNAFFYYVFEALAIPSGYLYKLSYAAAFFFIVAAVSLFSFLLFSLIKKEVMAVLISFFTIVNFYSIEYFLFIEKGLFFLGVFLCVSGTIFTVKYFEEQKKKLLFPAFLCLVAAVFIYQALLGLYAILCLPFLIYYTKNKGDFFLKNCMTALLYGLPMGLSFVVTKIIFQSSRISDSAGLHLSFGKVFAKTGEILFKRFFHIPTGLFCAFFLAVILLFLMTLFVSKKSITSITAVDSVGDMKALLLNQTGSKVRHLTIHCVSFLYLISASYIISFFPQLLGVTDSYSPRVLYPFASLFGVLLLYMILNMGGISFQRICFLSHAVLIFFLGIQYFNFQSVFIERYRSNQADRTYVSIISHQIEEYEKANDIKVNTICFYHDKNVVWWEEGYDESNLHPRAQSLGWSDLNSIHLYSGKEYEKGEPLPIYVEYFSEFDWNTYCEEQLIFEGDTLHVCIY